jgi:hypothetical protein
LFIPEQVRQIYHDRRVIKRLYIQEGEKKSIKASVHGMLSVGIMGIQNIGYKGKLPYELQLIIRACKVEEVVFVLDSDWDHLNNELKPGSRVDQRPWSFYHAVKNYRDYFKTFINENIYLEIYFAHIRDNEAREKGIDDLLAGSLNGKVKEFLDDLNEAFNLKEGDGKFIQVHKISTVSDTKLLEYWSLHNAEAFATRYKPFLEDLPEFTIGKHRWKFDEKWKLTPAQPLEDDELFWESQIRTDKKGNEYSQYYFNYRKAYIFLRRRGYGRIEMVSGEDQLCHIDNKVVGILNSYRIRDYMIEFTEAVLEEKDKDAVMNMFFRGGKMYFGPDSLSNMKYVNPVFEVADKNYQYLFFQDMFWKITAEGIEEKPLSDLQNYVWKDKVNDFKATLLKNEMVTVDHIDEAFIKKNNLDPGKYSEFIGQFDVSLSKESDDCHFLKFLGNTGEFFWRKFQDPKTRQPTHDTRSFDEKFETNLHLVSKMTAIGYLLHKYRDKSCEKAVIGMDGKLSEVGDSNGRTGKSIMGMAIGYVIPQIYIGAKSKDLEGDAFIFEEVSEKTDNIFLDDVRANIDFEFFFPIITGRLTVNRKGQQKFTLPDNDTPKMYITTNHAINGNSASFKDRQFLIAFSDYYNEDHKPIYDFGINFFDEWDQQQWNLFYNFMANCMQLYFKAAQKGWGVGQSGLISPPTERLELRRLRQFIGEDFLTWAGEYFNIEENKPINSNSGNNLNRDIARSILYNDFLEKTPTQRKFITPQRFKKKMTSWCLYIGLKFNPQYINKEGNPGGDDKRGGIEYFTIANGRFPQS